MFNTISRRLGFILRGYWANSLGIKGQKGAKNKNFSSFKTITWV